MKRIKKLPPILYVLLLSSVSLPSYAPGGRGAGPMTLEAALMFIAMIIIVTLIACFFTIRTAALAEKLSTMWFSLVGLLVGMAVIIVLFAWIYQSAGLHSEFSTSLYFSMVTWSTLGYGDFTPNESTRFFAAFEALIGYLFLGLFISIFYRCLTFARGT